MQERRLEARKLINTAVRLYHPEFGRVDGVIKDISISGAAIQLNSYKDIAVDSENNPLLLRPINIDILYPVTYLRQSDLELVVKFIEENGPVKE